MKIHISIYAIMLCISLTAFSQDREIITIETDNHNIILSATPNQPVTCEYWGNKLKSTADFITRGQHYAQLYPAYGGTYYLNPALRVTHAEGLLTTELVYDNKKVNVIDNNRVQTVISMKDKLYPLYVDVHFTAYKKENIIIQSIKIHHKEKGTIKLHEVSSSYIPMEADKYYLTHFHGSWGQEMRMKEEELGAGTKVIDFKKGMRPTQNQSPSFLISADNPPQENSGDVYAGFLAWTGNYSLSFQIDEGNKLHINSGINPFASTYNLKQNEVFETPEMILSYSDKGKGQISRNFHDWARSYGIAHGNQPSPILLNSWEGTYFKFDEAKITEMIDNAANIGVEMFVLDDGWFGNKYPRDNDKAGLGDWQVNTTKLPNGLGYLADHAVSKGIKFGIWIEPEMVNPKSELAEKHPDWIVKSGERDIPQMRNQWLLDLSNPKVQDFVFSVFDQVASMSPNISYVKWDANRHVANVGSTYLTKDNQSHFWYDYIKGLYKVYERIRAKYPDIIIQACASGGGRMEYGIMKYHDEFWTSDNTNAIDRIYMQYGVSTFFPSKTIASHVSTSPNHQTGMVIPLKFRFDVAVSGRLGLELQPKDIQGKDLEFAQKAIKTYKDIRPVIQFGDLYRLKSPYDGTGYASLMYVSKDKKQAVFFGYSLEYHNPIRFQTKLNGLNAGKKYKITELNTINSKSTSFASDKTLSGEFLMQTGINLNIKKPFESSVLLLTEE